MVPADWSPRIALTPFLFKDAEESGDYCITMDARNAAMRLQPACRQGCAEAPERTMDEAPFDYWTGQRSGMKRRYLYVFMFSAPAFLASIIVSVLMFAAAAGFLWIFVFGDSPWPGSASTVLTAVLVLVFAAALTVFLSIAYVAGKKQEGRATLNARHVLVSVCTTALLVLLVVAHQWSVGNIGPKSDDAWCSEFCRHKGFSSSGILPGDAGSATCCCFDRQGQEVKVSMTDVYAGTGR